MNMICTLLKGLQEEYAHPAIAIDAQVSKNYSLFIGLTSIVICVPTVDNLTFSLHVIRMQCLIGGISLTHLIRGAATRWQRHPLCKGM